MAERARMRGRTLSAERYQDGANDLDRQAQLVRNLLLEDVGSAQEEIQEPASEEP